MVILRPDGGDEGYIGSREKAPHRPLWSFLVFCALCAERGRAPLCGD